MSKRRIDIEAARGHLGKLKEFYEAGFEINTETMMYAARYNRLQVMKWIYEVKGAELFSVSVMMMAVKSGNLEMVKWLRDRGCPYDGTVLSEATRNLEILQYLWDVTYSTVWTFQMAMCYGDLSTLRWLRENGCLMGKVSPESFRRCDSETRCWLQSIGCQVYEDVEFDFIDCL